MNSILAQPLTVSTSGPAGLLIVEPDGSRASLLKRILRPATAIELRVVPLVTDAIRAITEKIPDLVMTSPLMSTADEQELWRLIRHKRGASHVQVINLPHAIDTGRPTAPARRSVFDFLRRSPVRERPACDASTLRNQIEEYVAQAVAQREELNARIDLTGHSPSIVLANTTEMIVYGSKNLVPHDRDRRRGSRRMANDLPGVWSVRLPWGSDVKLVDISNSGVLFESASKISAGVTVDLQIYADQKNVSVPARMVRSEVSRVDALGVRYQMAAAFGRDVRLMDFDPAAGLLSPRVLTDLLTRVLGDNDRPAAAYDIIGRFESELRRMLPRRKIQIVSTLMKAQPGTESIYFTIDRRGPAARVLQVTFDSGTAPSEMEFKLLKTAANLAAVALEIAEMSEVHESRRSA